MSEIDIEQVREIWGRLKSRIDWENPGEAFAPDGGCIECTHGVTPNHLNTGLCPYHAMEKAVTGNRGHGIYRVLADIREAAGIGHHVMMTEIPEEVAAIREERDALQRKVAGKR